ncbi:MAG TPA: hypothetical protein VFS86_08225 [Rhodanobacteraceae bacterium]|nr:hypothetical protein [Rhodanobacteraceae bacterium]
MFALLQRVEADVEHAGDQFQLGVGFAVLAGPRISGDGFGYFGRRLSVRVELESQRWTKAFFGFTAGQVAGVGFAIHGQAEDASGASHALVRQHFFVDPARSRRRGRAQHDQVFGLREGCVDLGAEFGRTGQFFAVAEDRIQPARDRAVHGGGAHQPRRHAVRFQRLVQPVGPRLVAVAVADEGAVGERPLGGWFLHGSPFRACFPGPASDARLRLCVA